MNLARTINRVVRDGRQRAGLMIGRAILRLATEGAGLQRVQIDVLADETHDDVEHYQSYGFASRAQPGAEGVFLALGGARGNGVVICVDDRRYRLAGLEDGEVAIYDDLDQVVRLTREGIQISSPMPVRVSSDTALTVAAPRINLGDGASKKVARVGDAVTGGVITAGSSVVYAE